MDTSETYIKMCDCPEIQLTAEATYCSVRDNGHTWSWSNNVRCGAEGRFWHEKPDGKRIWLPRQDQLQEMVQGRYEKHPYILFNEFNYFSKGTFKLGYILESPEQLWLAFVMHELHGKKWDGQKWTASAKSLEKPVNTG